jgi:DNA-binding transcriptional MerR regulator
MTIQAFAKLCGCNPQTLRYYDKVGLLKPGRVDRFTGYRYYDEEQALTFVKIKNLQLGGFTIEEIKPLLDGSDADVYRAFEAKIDAQQARLEAMKEIQRSYRSEMTTMKETIDNIRKVAYLEGQNSCRNTHAWKVGHLLLTPFRFFRHL